MLDFIRGKAQSVFVKLAFGIIILVFVFWGVGGLGGPVVAVIVTVNDTPITEQDFRRQYEQSLQALESQSPELAKEMAGRPDFRQRILRQMIVQTLLLDEAKRAGLAVTPYELRKVIEGFPVFQDENGAFSPKLYVSIIESQGQKLSYFEEMLQRDILLQKLQNQVTAGAYVSPAELKNLYLYNAERRMIEYVMFSFKDELKNSVVKPEAVEKYYEAQKHALFAVPAYMELDTVLIGIEGVAETLVIDEGKVKSAYAAQKQSYAIPEQVHARHIIFLLGENPSEEKEADIQKRMKALADRLKKGESFEALAKKYSEDVSASEGGDLGYFSHDQMVEPFASAAFALEDGAVSEPIRTQYGYHLIKREGYKPAGVRSYEDVSDDLRTQLAQDEAVGKIPEILDQFLFAVIGGKNMEQAVKGLPLEVETTKRSPLEAIAKKWQLSPEQIDTLTKAPIGAVFETPLVVPQGYLLVSPKAFIPASVEPLDAVRATIVETLRHDEANKLAAAKAQATLEKMSTLAEETDAKESTAKTSENSEVAKLALPSALTSKVKQVTFGRDGVIGELGSNMQLMEAAFASELDIWLPEAFTLEDGSVLARVMKLEFPDDAQWKEMEGMLENAVVNAQKEQMFQAFTNLLSEKARIEMHNERVLLGK